MNDIEVITDRAIQSEDEDKFNIKERLVVPMCNIIQNNKIKPCSVALMGEWGCGKTSALNLLKNELRVSKKNIVIDFDPTLEGKFEIFELIENFYLKLYSVLSRNRKAKRIICKILKSLMVLTKSKWSISSNVGVVSAGVEYDFGKNIEDVMALWEKEKPQLIADKIKELNDIISDKAIYVIIDEIDRLPSKLILNFLMFARVLEVFDKLVCIIAIDYTRIIQKFIDEKSLGYCDYNSASSYLDKLFQMRFDVCNTINTYNSTRYAIGKLEKIIFEQKADCNILIEQINHDGESRSFFEKIISYLSTPRSINKWLINIIKNKNFIIKANNKLDWLAIIAVFVKLPIILDNVIRHLSPVFFKSEVKRMGMGLKSEIQQKYDIKIKDGIDDDAVLCALAGIKKTNDNNLDDLLQKVTSNPIEDVQTEKFFVKFIKNTPNNLFKGFLNGAITNEELNYYVEFFTGNIDNVLSYLIEDGDENTKLLLAEDLAKDLERGTLPEKSASVSVINKLWCTQIGNKSNLMGNPYGFITITLLKLLTIEQLIPAVALSLSEYYIELLLNIFGIKNNFGRYDFAKFKQPDEAEFINERFIQVKFKGKAIKEFDQEILKAIVDNWLKQVISSLENDELGLWARSEDEISILYRYVRWSQMTNKENSKKDLAEKLVNYLNNGEVTQECKKILIEELGKECRKYLNRYIKRNLGVDGGDPIKYLFGNDSQELFDTILKVAKVTNTDYFNDLQTCINESK